MNGPRVVAAADDHGSLLDLEQALMGRRLRRYRDQVLWLAGCPRRSVVFHSRSCGCRCASVLLCKVSAAAFCFSFWTRERWVPTPFTSSLQALPTLSLVVGRH
jgi:hypothetical protein